MPRAALAIAAARVRSTWENASGPSRLVAVVTIGAAVIAGAAHLARVGTDRMRLAGGALLVVALLVAVVLPIVERRLGRDPRRILRRIVGRTDAEQWGRIDRAADLVIRSRDEAARAQASGKPGGTAESLALAEVHLARSLWRIPLDGVTRTALASGRRWSLAAVVLGAVVAGSVAWAPFRVVERLAVLAARDGRAPIGLVFLDEVDGDATPPSYLKQPDKRIGAYGHVTLPRGTTVAVRGRPLHPARKLVLTDGVAEVPFVDDGTGDVVARWVLGDSTKLQMAARFGEVLVLQPDTLEIRSIADAPPTVVVEGAPKRVRLLDETRIPLVYEAKDDHGLTEIALVLRAGAREERRTLSRPASDRATERGGHELSTRDPFFKKSYVPVEITIQARDDDAVTGPKWGKSAPIVVVPPRIGEPESLRLAALRDVRDAFVDLLALRVDAPEREAKKLGVLDDDEKSALDKAQNALESAMSEARGGLPMKSRVRTIALGQARKLKEATAAIATKRDVASEKAWVAVVEELVLAIDASIEGVGAQDVATVSKRLADVADEAADAADAWRDTAQRADATARLDASVEVLAGGGEMLLTLGELGLDIGEIVQNDIRRIERSRTALQYRHAELAARDLAARLRKPDPSFRGGGGGHGFGGGVESGGQPSPSDGPASEADAQSRQTERTLEEILRDQAQEIQDVQDALDRALTQEEKDELKERAKQIAQQVRDAVKDLPRDVAVPDSAQSKAAEARQEAEAMAGSLEQGRLADAADRGQRAVEAMREASRRGSQSPYVEETESGKSAGAARPEIEKAMQEVADALRAMREKASERAKPDLEGSSQDEGKLGERTGDLAKKGEEGERAMPGEMLDQLREAEQAMKEAQQALKEGDGEGGLELQKKAHRLLEMARGERDEDGEGQEGRGKNDGEGRELAQETPVPKKAPEGPAEFRKRVLEGLGSDADPRLREAVRKYAEGLLQ
jgi:tetratricopeptide (TPR) repeat protein